MANPNKPRENYKEESLMDRRTAIQVVLSLGLIVTGLWKGCENPHPSEYVGKWGLDEKMIIAIETHKGKMPPDSKKLRCGEVAKLIMPICYTGTLVAEEIFNGKKISSIVRKVEKVSAGIYEIEGEHVILVKGPDIGWVMMGIDKSFFGSLKIANSTEGCFKPEKWKVLERISE